MNCWSFHILRSGWETMQLLQMKWDLGILKIQIKLLCEDHKYFTAFFFFFGGGGRVGGFVNHIFLLLNNSFVENLIKFRSCLVTEKKLEGKWQQYVGLFKSFPLYLKFKSNYSRQKKRNTDFWGHFEHHAFLSRPFSSWYLQNPQALI